MRSALITAWMVAMAAGAPWQGAAAPTQLTAAPKQSTPAQSAPAESTLNEPQNSPASYKVDPDKGDADYTAKMSAGMDAYVRASFSEAARSFEEAVNLRPGSSEAHYWAGQALVYGRQPVAAIAYLEAAQQLGVDSIALHLALVSAYAGANRTADLDRERELLHRWHQDGSHPTLAAREGFLLETFFTGSWHINVEEYFDPPSANGTVWRFVVRDPAEVVEMTYLLELAPPGSRPGTAYALVRQTHRSGELDEHRVVHRYVSVPSYSEAKADVTAKLHFRIPGN